MTRIAYLASQYPAPSHTFIRREIAALRTAGIKIVPFSVRPASEGGKGLDAEALAETQTVLGRSPISYAGAMLGALARPLRFASTLHLALRHRPAGLRAALWSLFHFVEALQLAQLIRASGAVHLHCHFANSGATVGMLAAHYLAMPWSMTLHGISETDYPSGLLLPDKLQRASFVACASWFMRAQAMRVSPPEVWPKLHIVRCGVDLSMLPASAEPQPGPFRFACVGRLSPEKGHSGLFAALARLREQGCDIAVDLIGDGPRRQELEAEAARVGIADRVRFLGALDEVATLEAINRTGALVLPSLMEGLPVVLMEAMALSRPVVSSTVAGIPELVQNGTNGLLFRPSDWEQLAAAMARIATDGPLRARLATSARQSIESEFSIEKAVLPLIGLFRKDAVT